MSGPESAAISSLCTFIRSQWGLDFGENRGEQLLRAVQQRMQDLGFASALDYLRWLTGPGQREQESRSLLDLITVNETFFFRHKAQFDILRDPCLPAILERNRETRRIHVWSAACSTGEEPYTLAMILREALPAASGWNVLIRGTDICTRTLLQARGGLYGKRTVGHLEPGLRERYLARKGDKYLLAPEIRHAVQFRYFNLACDPFPPDEAAPWDIIFCRNVMIYFSKEHVRRLLENLHRSLADHGYLFTGHSEMLSFLHDGFEPMEVDGTFVYRKRRPGRSAGAGPLRSAGRAFRGTKPSTASGRGGFGSGPKPQASTPGPLPPIRDNRPGAGGAPCGREAGRAASPAGEGGPPAALPGSYEAALAEAKRLADRGETQQAVERLGDLVEQHPLRPETYFQLAMIHLARQDLDPAFHYLKKAVYLQPGEPLLRMCLAEAYREKGRSADALREYANVIECLEQEPDAPLGEHASDFTREALLETARTHLNAVRSVKR